MDASKAEKDIGDKFHNENDILSALQIDRNKSISELLYYENKIIRLEELLRDAKFQAQNYRSA